MPSFETSQAYRPTGDQPTAIASLAEGLKAGERYQTLLGATGTGKTATMAWVIEQVQKSALFTRRDVVVVASVSCIYGLGSPEEWRERVLILNVGEEQDRDLALRKLIDSQYVRNDSVLGRGRFRVKGDVVEIQPANSETAYRISFFGDEVEQISHFDPLTGEIYAKLDNVAIWPATEYVTSKPTIERALHEIRHELEEQVKMFELQGKMLEAHRLRQRTEYDLEMLQELGFCSGIENYSRILEGRAPGTHPFTLLDYFPNDFVVFVDESHQTVPQLGGMHEGELRATRNQIDDLLSEIRRREEAGERVLVTTLTKKMAEDLTDYLLESGVKARYLHSEVDTLERIQIIRELRLGDYDVLVGVNLLREGLDLPEVSLIAILDADKEGFLRGRTALIQTIGRAARNTNGRVLMYADKLTEAIKGAIDETDRRRAKQLAYNEEHGITPESIQKGVSDIAEFLALESPTVPGRRRRDGRRVEGMTGSEIETLIVNLEEEMFAAAEELRFEYAAKLRDEIKDLRRELTAVAETSA